MRKIAILVFFTVLFAGNLFSQTTQNQEPKKKGSFYFAWGYNKDYFSKSDIHFINDGSDHYDFTLINATAADRPGYDQIFHSNLSIPQYVYRFGYYFNDKRGLGIEINFDHTKYVMNDNRVVHLKGTIHGTYYDLDTLVKTDFVKFEHTNGANFLMINLLKKHTFYTSKNNQHVLSSVLKIGAGIVVPKTDVRLFDERLDNVFHVAGYVTGLDGGLRYEFRQRLFTEATVKGTFANYFNVLTVGTGKADHTFFTAEIILAVGVRFPL